MTTRSSRWTCVLVGVMAAVTAVEAGAADGTDFRVGAA